MPLYVANSRRRFLRRGYRGTDGDFHTRRSEDDGGVDAKVVAVPVSKLTPLYDKVQTTDDLPELLMKQTVHFFEHYKDLEPGKWVKVLGWGTVEEAKAEIVNGLAAAKK